MFIPIKKLLNKSIKKSGVSRQVEAAMILEEFKKIIEKIFGEKIKSKVKPLYVRDKVLTVACLSSVLAQELKLKQNLIVNHINKKFGKEVVEKLRFLA